MKPHSFFLLFSLCWLFSCSNPGEHERPAKANALIEEARKANKLITGKVVGISDGDTFKLLAEDNQTLRVRLHGIDAPERAQAYSTQSRQALSDLIFSKEVAVVQKTKDRYGRIVGIVFAGETNVNEALLQQGLAWHYTEYDRNEAWASLQREAKKAKRGLWNQRDPTPPWQWRKEKRAAAAE